MVMCLAYLGLDGMGLGQGAVGLQQQRQRGLRQGEQQRTSCLFGFD